MDFLSVVRGGYNWIFPDISAVNGANLTIDVYPRGGDAMNPTSKTDFHWLAYNWPLTVHGEDLREPGRCQTATTGVFQLFRSDIDKTVSMLPNYPLLGYVIVDGNGNPTMPPGNNVLACLSNCGKYKFPTEKDQPAATRRQTKTATPGTRFVPATRNHLRSIL